MVKLLSKFRPLTLFLLVLITACSSVQTNQQPSAVSGPSPNLATVYFYRTQSSPGAAVDVDIKDNGIDSAPCKMVPISFTTQTLANTSLLLPRIQVRPRI